MSKAGPPLEGRIVLHPGQHRVARRGAVLQTLLGSCVACCIYDEWAGVAGMNHFLLANKRYSKSMPLAATEAGRYGIYAMEILINDMVKEGADRRRLKAKLFGAGAVIGLAKNDNFTCVGEVNARFAREYARIEGIPVVAEDLGGTRGRVIYFDAGDFTVYRRFIASTETVEVERMEHDFWGEELAAGQAGGEIVLFGP